MKAMRGYVLVGLGIAAAFGAGLSVGYATLTLGENGAHTAKASMTAQPCYWDPVSEEEVCVDDRWANSAPEDGSAPYFFDSRGNIVYPDGPPENMGEISLEDLNPYAEIEAPSPEWTVGDELPPSYYSGSGDDSSPYDMESGWTDSEGNVIDVYDEPWYVRAFPGIGQMVQRILPGQSQVVVRPLSQTSQSVYPQPSCWISAQPAQVVSGGSAALSWSSFYASRAMLSGFGTVALSGSQNIPNIRSSATFTLSVHGQGGSGSCYARVNVVAGGVPSCVISANPDTISGGQSASVAWGTQNASSATLSGYGTVSTMGAITVRPAQSTSYTLTAQNTAGQSQTCTTRVTVR